jgi:hypothetical protein
MPQEHTEQLRKVRKKETFHDGKIVEGWWFQLFRRGKIHRFIKIYEDFLVFSFFNIFVNHISDETISISANIYDDPSW